MPPNSPTLSAATAACSSSIGRLRITNARARIRAPEFPGGTLVSTDTIGGPPLGSYVKIVRLRGGDFAVATYLQKSPNTFVLEGRWFSDSYGQALLKAQLWAAKGYELRI